MKFNYALEYEDYSLRSALLWGNCCRHFQKSREGALGHRIVHALIGITELIPIISQIASIFEKILVTWLGDHPTTLKSSSAKTEQNIGSIPSKPDETFNAFQERTLSELPANIKRQEENPSHKRSKLSPVTEEGRNSPIELSNPPDGIEFYARGATFYGYNAEGIRDYGWGCAWRAIQTCLSSYGKKIAFTNLFHLFGPLHNLKRIYQYKYSTESLPSKTNLAPYDQSEGWADPFIGEMVMHFYGISADLERVNGIPNKSQAPESVFHKPVLSFSSFKNRLEEHFKKENAAPIMIDDGTYTLNIVGIGCAGEVTTLWVTDPHIQEGVNRHPTEKTANGLYTITLDSSGAQIGCSVDEGDQHQKANLFNERSYQGLHFNQKHWAVLFPQ